MRSLRRYQSFFLLLLAGTLTAGFAFNTAVNPWRVTPMPWTSESMEPYRAIDKNWSRTSKAGLVRSGRWDAAIFGSSRVDITLDPRHPAFEGMRCVNLGLNAGPLTESHPMFRYFIDRHDPRLVVLTIDAGDLSTPPPAVNLTDFALSPLDPAANPLERELRYHVGISALAASTATAGRALRRSPAEHTPQGFRREAVFPDNQRQLIASLYMATIWRLARARAALDGLSPEKLAMLEDIVARCREKNTRLVVLFTPNHALFQLAFPELRDPDPYFSRDRRALAELAARANAAAPDAAPVEVWDFLDGHPLNSPPLPPADRPGSHLDGWIDLFHAVPAIGDRMLDRLKGGGSYGVPLFPETVDTRAGQVRAGLDAYAARHPDDIDFLRESLAKFQSTPKP